MSLHQHVAIELHKGLRDYMKSMQFYSIGITQYKQLWYKYYLELEYFLTLLSFI